LTKEFKLNFSLVFFLLLYLPPTRLPSLSNTAIPSRISFHRINGKLTQLAPATAANGTNRAIIGGNFETAARMKNNFYNRNSLSLQNLILPLRPSAVAVAA
jgi:hypothetical protein